MKKILIVLIACMFVISVLPGIIAENEADETFKERRYKETRKTIPVYTDHGLVKVPVAKGKPVYYVIITSPTGDVDLSGTVTITIDANTLPSIYIDGVFFAKSKSIPWDTTAYSDGEHTIYAEDKGASDSVTVTVDNGGGGNTAPVVTITYPSNGATVSGTVTITANANDAEEGNLDADIYIGGNWVATANSYIWDTTSYTDDDYIILAEVEDSGGLTGTDSVSVTVDNGGGNPVDKYALVIGISNYEGTANDLQYCDDDADDWAFFLNKEGYTVTILKDEDATADGIIAAVDNLLALEDGNDYVAFTYSGHGYKAPGAGSSIITQDLYYITHGWFEQRFANSDSPHIYFTLDACVIGGFSGLIDNNKVGAFASNRRSSYDGTPDMQNGVYTYYQMLGWQSFDNFEEDGAYAAQMLINWASARGLRADPFLVDMFDGPMMP